VKIDVLLLVLNGDINRRETCPRVGAGRKKLNEKVAKKDPRRQRKKKTKDNFNSRVEPFFESLLETKKIT